MVDTGHGVVRLRSCFSWRLRAQAASPAARTAPPPRAAAHRAASSGAVPRAVVYRLSEAIRERIDQLRYDEQHDVRGARIILDDVVAQYYETHQFAPAWQDPARLDALVATIMDVATDGLDPADYHLEALRSYRLDLRMRTPLTQRGSRRPRTDRDRCARARAVPRVSAARSIR